MKMETKQKVKEFYEKRKLEIVAGSLIFGGIVIACILKPKTVEIHDVTNIEVLPKWAEKWKAKCDDEILLYENGLPVFADEYKQIVYRDALAPEYSVKRAEEDGFTIIERDVF